jgi:hypothetical protein
MADGNDQAVASLELTADTPDGDEQTVSLANYQALQRNITSLQRVNKTLLLDKVRREGDNARVEHVETTLGDLVQQLVGADIFEGDEMTKLSTKMTTSIGEMKQSTSAREAIAEVIADTDIPWDDDRFSDVRDSWDRGSYEEAAILAKVLAKTTKSTGKTTNQSGDSDAADKAWDTRTTLQDVDTSGGATTVGGIPTSNVPLLKQKLQDPMWAKEHLQEILKLAGAGKIKLSA